MKAFVHRFDDVSQDGTLSFDTDAPSSARIELNVEQGGDVWLAANQEGFAHLARVFAELALGDYEDGYHFHKSFRFVDSNGSPELSIEVRKDW